MRAGKAQSKSSDHAIIPLLHLALIEEPDVHLHTQVEQVPTGLRDSKQPDDTNGLAYPRRVSRPKFVHDAITETRATDIMSRYDPIASNPGRWPHPLMARMFVVACHFRSQCSNNPPPANHY